MLPIPIEKLPKERDSFRKAREAHIIHKAKALEPLGINKRDNDNVPFMTKIDHPLMGKCRIKARTKYHAQHENG